MRLFLIFFLLTSCASKLVNHRMNPETIYKKDMIIEIDGQEFEGVAVVSQKKEHEIHITARGDLDLLSFKTCHREETAESAWNVTERRGFIFKRTIHKKREAKFTYKPNYIERRGGCPVFIEGYENEKGRHSQGFIDFETPEATLKGTLHCNGKTIKNKTVTACQVREGLITAISFDEKVIVNPDEGCSLGKSEGKYFEFQASLKDCVYAFFGKNGNIHRFTMLPYELPPIRK